MRYCMRHSSLQSRSPLATIPRRGAISASRISMASGTSSWTPRSSHGRGHSGAMSSRRDPAHRSSTASHQARIACFVSRWARRTLVMRMRWWATHSRTSIRVNPSYLPIRRMRARCATSRTSAESCARAITATTSQRSASRLPDSRRQMHHGRPPRGETARVYYGEAV